MYLTNWDWLTKIISLLPFLSLQLHFLDLFVVIFKLENVD